MRTWPALLLLVPLLAGCTGVAIPDDAVTDTDPAVPEGLLSAWVEQDGGAVIFHGVFENQGTATIWLRYGEWPKPWDLHVQDASGTDLTYTDRQRPRDFWYQAMGGGEREEFQFTWGRQVYGDNVTVAPPGDYTAVIQLRTGDPEATFTAEVPFRLDPVET